MRQNLEVSALVSALHGGNLPAGTRGLFTDLLLSRLLDVDAIERRLTLVILSTFGVSRAKRIARTAAKVAAGDSTVPVASSWQADSGVHDSSEVLGESPITEVDLLVLTPKPNELRAVLLFFGVAPGVLPVQVSKDVETWLIEYQGLKVAVSMIGGDGNIASSVETSKILHAIKARLYCLVGMAIGLRGEVELGDVVVATHMWDFENQVLRPGADVPRPRVISQPPRFIQRLQSFSQVDPDWSSSVGKDLEARGELPSGNTSYRPNFTTGVVATGEKLHEDNGATLSHLAEFHQGRVKAAEMEGGGFASACSSDGVRWVVVRGVADFGEAESRSKEWQVPATFAAVSALMALVRSRRIQLSEPGA